MQQFIRERVESDGLNRIPSTTAGYKNTFAYDKLIFLLSMMVIKPKEFFVMGGTYKVPVMEGMLEKNFVKNLKNDPTYDMSSFDREYGSEWSGAGEGGFFNGEEFDRTRVLKFPEYSPAKKNGKFYYIFSIDVGRFSDKTEILIWKVFPQGMTKSIKHVVNMFSIDKTNTVKQCLAIHRLYDLFAPKRVIIDANGLGVGLMDNLVLPIDDPVTGDRYAGWGVMNDDKDQYSKDYTRETIYNVIYQIKATPEINTVAYMNAQEQIRTCKVKTLINQRDAKVQLEMTKRGQEMSTYEKEKFLLPYSLATTLKDETLNMYREDNDGISNDKNITLKKSNAKLHKDKFSSLIYGLYYLKLFEDDLFKDRSKNLKDFFRIS